jgi:2,3-bisphosphoglycerate-independent phosphoglycerate mutase
MARVLMIFVDGLGLGEAGEYNPLATVPTPGLKSYLAGAPLTLDQAGPAAGPALLLPLDASLGVPGVPQSATGQATLFSGRNAAALLGRHLKGFPNGALRRLLEEEGLPGRLQDRGFRPVFANAFRPPFFEALARGIHFFSCSTAANYYAGLPFHTLEDAEAGRALYADITHENVRAQGYDLTVITPEEAARRLSELAGRHDYTLFEYFLTDIAAHARDVLQVQDALTRLDRLMGALPRFLPADTLILLTSDHGNIEDLRVPGHTCNPVPALALGPNKEYFRGMQSIADVAPAVLGYLEEGR